MAMLMKLIKAVVGASFFKRIIRDALGPAIIAYLMSSRKLGMLPRYLKILIEGAAALTMLRSMKGRWIMQPAVVSALIAILAAMMKPKEDDPHHKNRVIDIDEYRVVEEK